MFKQSEMMPCPFCGQNNYLCMYSNGEPPESKDRRYYMHCSYCDANGPASVSRECAVKSWEHLWRAKSKEEKANAAALENIIEKCGACGGKGFQYIEFDGESERDPCDDCNGSGYVFACAKEEVETFIVSALPFGANNNARAEILALVNQAISLNDGGQPADATVILRDLIVPKLSPVA